MLLIAMLTFICLSLALVPSLAYRQCGLQGDNLRIIGGSETKHNQYPWMLRMTVKWSNGQKSGCGASIIDEQWAVTAAHCVYPPQSGLEVSEVELIAGDHSRSKDEGTEVYLYAADFITHQGHSMKTHDNDICLIKFNRRLDFDGRDKRLMPICLSRHALDTVNTDECTASGWGKTSEGQPIIPFFPFLQQPGKSSDVLKHVRLPIQSDEKCRDVYPDYYHSDTMLCAGGEEGQDSCHGDSGGPLQCPLANGAWILTGIVSFGGKCAIGNPAVYTRVENYIDWIEDQTAGS